MNNTGGQSQLQRYRCPHCGALIEADEPIDGMQVECPACGHGFVAEAYVPEDRAGVKASIKTQLESRLTAAKKLLARNPKARIGIGVGVAVLVGLLLCPSCPGSLGEGKSAGERRTIKLPGGAKMEMVWCPPGTFWMGSPQSERGRKRDETQHQVRLTQGFWMARTEVTQGQWKSVMGNNPSRNTGNDELPVEEVTWEDCMRFCQKTGLQLPTEAQWEYACRAGTKTPYHWEHLSSGGHQGNFLPYPSWDFSKPIDDFLKVNTCPVQENWKNHWGFYNMHGNVREWCADWYGPYQGGPEIDPKGPSSGYARVMRGGAATSHSDECRSASRESRGPTDDPYLWTGFRPVLIP